jgi:5'-phosphate synthase pdxT subunit
VKIGVLAVQGDFREHVAVLRRLGADVVEVRKPEQLEGLDGLVVPGGESTSITRLMKLYGLWDEVRAFERPIFGTCAGMIVLASDAVDAADGQEFLGRADVVVRRNAYGRQTSSFETDLELVGDSRPVHAVFIRAPRIEHHGPHVDVLAELDGAPVLVRDGDVLLAAFHPELTDDTRVHELFLDTVRKEAAARISRPPARR